MKINEATTVEERAVALLAEFRDLCEANGWEYYLAPRVLIRVIRFGNLEENFAMPEVLMPIKDALKVIDWMDKNKPEGRSIEYMENYPAYRSYSIDYVDENSTYIQVNRGTDFSKYGIKIIINMIRDDVRNTACAALETGWERNSFNPSSKGTWKTFVVRRTVRGMQAFDKKMAPKLFERFTKAYTKDPNSKNVFVRSYNLERKYFPRSILSKTTTIELNGESFRIPEDVDTYLTAFYDENWMETELSMRNPRNLITAYNIPFEDSLKRLEEIGIPVQILFDGYIKRRHATDGADDILKSRARPFRMAKRSGERMYFYEMLHPQIDRIRELRARGDYEELREIFQEYDDRVKTYLNIEMGLCADKELMEIECELLRHEGRPDLADKLIELSPPEHMKPLVEPEKEAAEND